MPPDAEGAYPDVIGELVAYLMSPKAHFTTGKFGLWTIQETGKPHSFPQGKRSL